MSFWFNCGLGEQSAAGRTSAAATIASGCRGLSKNPKGRARRPRRAVAKSGAPSRATHATVRPTFFDALRRSLRACRATRLPAADVATQGRHSQPAEPHRTFAHTMQSRGECDRAMRMIVAWMFREQPISSDANSRSGYVVDSWTRIVRSALWRGSERSRSRTTLAGRIAAADSRRCVWRAFSADARN